MDMDKLQGLDNIVSEADAMGGPTPEQAQEAQAQQAQNVAAMEWAAIAYTIGGALAILAPELREKVYTVEACNAWGESAAAVAEKYGWNGPSNVPELGLLMATMGLAVPSVIVIRHRIKSAKAEDADKGGVLEKIKAWWRDKQAAKAAAVAARSAQHAADNAVMAGAAGGG